MNQENQRDPNADDGIEWDNGEATYGHKLPEVKRKDSPDDEHLTKSNVNASEELKNLNLSQDEDLANRNQSNNKGIAGKDL